MVVDNGREALLFEPGDPVDLARKVLRLIGEPELRDRIAEAGYERVRRDFTASAARRHLRDAYTLLTERFADQFSHDSDDDAPKIEILSDDDFEATVFEEAPQAPPVDTALNQIADPESFEAMASTGHTSSENVVAPPMPADQTMERVPVAPPPKARASSEAWTQSVLVAPPPPAEDWVVTNVAAAAAIRSLEEDASSETVAAPDDGTPIEGVRAPTPLPQVSSDSAFVAGEIDVPTPAPEKAEFTAASKLLGGSGSEPSDPDTGSRTPPLQRRSQ